MSDGSHIATSWEQFVWSSGPLPWGAAGSTLALQLVSLAAAFVLWWLGTSTANPRLSLATSDSGWSPREASARFLATVYCVVLSYFAPNMTWLGVAFSGSEGRSSTTALVIGAVMYTSVSQLPLPCFGSDGR